MSTNNGITARFWGVRGSVPAPLTPAKVEEKVTYAVMQALAQKLPLDSSFTQIREWLKRELPFERRATFGGNTTCVEVRCGSLLIILDMGTGIRELGLSLLPQVFQRKGFDCVILQSHVHWDHIQGVPFWAELYMGETKGFHNNSCFYGGKEWDKSLEEVLRGQMDQPVFPIDFGEITQTGMKMQFETVYDGKVLELITPEKEKVHVLVKKLNHPQETFGYRIEYKGEVFTFCTDHEPYAALDPNLVTLARGADVFVTDCQYTYHGYCGHGGVSKLGWGHSYPEYIAEVVREAKPRVVITTHHDPQADDELVMEIARKVQEISSIKTLPAYEGLNLRCSEFK